MALDDPLNLEARGAMLLGAHYAGLGIENAMLGAAHALANPLTAHYGIAHGLAVGMVLPHVVRYNATVVPDLYAELAKEAGLTGEDRPDGAEAVAQRVADIMGLMDLPTRLRECDVGRGILPLLAEEALQQWTGRFNPRPVTEEDLLALYEMAY